MTDPFSVEQYTDALQHALTEAQVNILRALYAMPNSSATAKQLAEKLGYPSYHRANFDVGRIGKDITHYLGMEPPTYFDGRKDAPAYFLVVGEYLKTGWNMWPALQQAMEEFSSTLDPLVNTTAIPEESVEIYVEGKVVEVVTDRFERDPKARLRCIEHYGANCHACGFNFAEHYGERASGYIQVHHKMPLAQRRGEYTVDPVMDLIPLCANCHVVVHLTDPPMDMEGLAAILQGTKGAN